MSEIVIIAEGANQTIFSQARLFVRALMARGMHGATLLDVDVVKRDVAAQATAAHARMVIFMASAREGVLASGFRNLSLLAMTQGSWRVQCATAVVMAPDGSRLDSIGERRLEALTHLIAQKSVTWLAGSTDLNRLAWSCVQALRDVSRSSTVQDAEQEAVPTLRTNAGWWPSASSRDSGSYGFAGRAATTDAPGNRLRLFRGHPALADHQELAG